MHINSFYINLPIGGVAAAIIMVFFVTPKQAKPVDAPLKEKLLQMDFLGSFLIMASITSLILALQWAGVTKSWRSGDVIGTLIGFVLIAILFGINEWYMGERALLMPRLLKRKTMLFMGSFQVFNSATFMVLLYYLPIYFQVVSGVSAAKSGIHNLPFILGIGKSTHAPRWFLSISSYIC